MKYLNIIDDFDYFDKIYLDISKIPDFAFMKCNYPNTIKKLIQEDYKYVKKIIDLYFADTKYKLSIGSINYLDDIIKLELMNNNYFKILEDVLINFN